MTSANVMTTIRPFRGEDAHATAEIFFDAVRRGAGPGYDEAQRRAWAPAVPNIGAWRDRLNGQTVLVAERNGRVVGFMSLTDNGLIDLAYVVPEHMGRGVARRLYDGLLEEATKRGLTKLRTEFRF